MSEDKPRIRLHRYERILAVKWPGDDHWLMIWPDPYPDLAPPGKPPCKRSGAGSPGTTTWTATTGSTLPPTTTAT